MSNVTEPTEQWGVVEMMGHRQVAGRISELTRFGTTFLQIEIPQPDGTFAVQLIGGSAIYDLHYTSESKARAIAPRSPVLVDKALPAPEPIDMTELHNRMQGDPAHFSGDDDIDEEYIGDEDSEDD